MKHVITATMKDGTSQSVEFDDPGRAEAELTWVQNLRARGVDEPCISWRCVGAGNWVLNPADIRSLGSRVVEDAALAV